MELTLPTPTTGSAVTRRRLFIRAFQDALRNEASGYPDTDVMDPEKFGVFYINVERRAWASLEGKRFSRETFKNYCRVIKKCLWWQIDDWDFAARTTWALYEAAFESIEASENEDGTFFDEHLTYSDALKREVERLRSTQPLGPARNGA